MLEHRFAKLVAGAAFVLIVIGGLVNATGSGLACPEPTLRCHGEFFPALTASNGVLYEHGHREVAELVGVLQLVLTILLIRRRPELKKLAWLLLAMISVQATLGALTVYYKLPWYISSGHWLLAMSYFATLIYTAFRTRPMPSVVELERHDKLRAELGGARRWIALTCGAVFVQLVLGALVRHLDAASACLGMPACTPHGDWWADSLPQHLHMIHRGFGVVVAAITTTSAIMILRNARSWARLRMLAMVAPVVVAGQITLGIFTVLTFRAVPLAVGHVAGAECLWAVWIAALVMTGSRIPTRPSSRATRSGLVPVTS